MAWISPTGNSGTWTNPTNAYDGSTTTYAYPTFAIDYENWSATLLLTFDAVDCDKVRIWSGRSNTDITQIKVEIRSGTSYTTIKEGATSWGQWVTYYL